MSESSRMRSWPHSPSQLAAYRGTGYELIPLNHVEACDHNGRLIGKAPLGSKWRVLPALSVDEAREHMVGSGCNVGVRLRPEDLVLDVDPRNFAEGDDPLQRLQEDLGVDLSDYPTVVTGSGGRHIYMTKPADALLRDTLEAYQGVEFKCHGRQVVAPGSIHPGDLKTGLAAGGAYLWEDDPLAPTLANVRAAPDALIELARRPGRLAAVDSGKRSPEELDRMLNGVDPCSFREHGRWLEMMMACHHATGGEGRDEFVAWSTGDPEFSSDAWKIGRRWDSLSSGGEGRRVTERTLFKALVDGGRADLLPRESAASDFSEVEEVQAGSEGDDDLTDEEGEPGNPLERMNAKGYCAVNDNGIFRIYRPKRDYQTVSRDTPEPRTYWETMRKPDFLDFLSNHRIEKGERTAPLAAEWLQWSGRTTYDGVAFDPGCKIPKEARVLNLWTDWAVEPVRGDWSIMQRLLLEGLCDGDEAMYEYVLDWSAFMVQHPDEQAEVALVFQGGKGTGKGTYCRSLFRLAGRHGMHISNQHHFTSHFNAHLRDCVFLFADEAMWAGDKRAEGELKRLITEPTIQIEAKGKDVTTARNMLHVAMASNEDWVIPASMDDERRFAVTQVNPKFRGNRAFFASLYEQMNSGGLQALLFDLKRRRLAGFHPRARIPQTSALAKQKLQSLDSFDAWYYESLCIGRFAGAVEASGDWEDGDARAETVFFAEDLQSSLEEHLRKLGDRQVARRASTTVIGDRLRKRLGRACAHVRMTVPSDRLDVRADSAGRAYAYRLPSLSECRAMFEAQLGSKLPWTQDVEEVDFHLQVEELA